MEPPNLIRRECQKRGSDLDRDAPRGYAESPRVGCRVCSDRPRPGGPIDRCSAARPPRQRWAAVPGGFARQCPECPGEAVIFSRRIRQVLPALSVQQAGHIRVEPEHREQAEPAPRDDAQKHVKTSRRRVHNLLIGGFVDGSECGLRPKPCGSGSREDGNPGRPRLPSRRQTVPVEIPTSRVTPPFGWLRAARSLSLASAPSLRRNPLYLAWRTRLALRERPSARGAFRGGTDLPHLD